MARPVKRKGKKKPDKNASFVVRCLLFWHQSASHFFEFFSHLAQKAKRKLGRKLKPSNVPDTDFRTRGVVLSGRQTVIATTSLAQIDTCLGVLSHQRNSARRDALQDLKDVLSKCESREFYLLVERKLTSLIRVFELANDVDLGVRTALHLFAQWFVTNMRPHLV